MRPLLLLALAGAGIGFGLGPLGLSWPLAATLVAGTAAFLILGRAAGRHRVVAVRSDRDFGRIALLEDGRWGGAVPLAGLPRTIDVEIEGAGEGPSLAQRLAYQDACAQFPELVPSLAEALGRDPSPFEESARFLLLRLPQVEDETTPDWSLCFAEEEGREAPLWQADVRGGELLGVRRVG